MDKSFREKIERNRKSYDKMVEKNKGDNGNRRREDNKYASSNNDRKNYKSKTNKPKPITYEATFDIKKDDPEDVLHTIEDNVKELQDFLIDVFTEEDSYDYIINDIIEGAAKYLYFNCPRLVGGINAKVKGSISANGFTIRLENGTELKFSAKYHIEKPDAILDAFYCSITFYNKPLEDSINWLKQNHWNRKNFNEYKKFERKPRVNENED